MIEIGSLNPKLHIDNSIIDLWVKKWKFPPTATRCRQWSPSAGVAGCDEKNRSGGWCLRCRTEKWLSQSNEKIYQNLFACCELGISHWFKCWSCEWINSPLTPVTRGESNEFFEFLFRLRSQSSRRWEIFNQVDCYWILVNHLITSFMHWGI